jgi:hypothetical protein
MTNIDEKKRYSMKKVTEITWKNSWQISYYIKKWFIKKNEYMQTSENQWHRKIILWKAVKKILVFYW